MSWTISEFAHIGDVTVRTLRYYDKINLLKPSDYTEGGHRLYVKDDLHILQQIQALKHFGFSLGEIQHILLQNNIPKENFLERIRFQKELLLAEQERIVKVLKHMDEMVEIIGKEERIDVPLFCSVLQTFVMEKENREWLEKLGIEDIHDRELKLKFNRQFMSLIKQVKRYREEKKDPAHADVQAVVKELNHLIEEMIQSAGISQSNFESLVKQNEMPLAEFPVIWREEEEKYVKEVMKIVDE
ncbi:MerR family transcriptional regulator [Bacillus cytotoxicus]|uniref:A0A073K8I9 (MerR family transcriptional regulator) n=1 Tax=Bacillus cytotoxicus TaxID=580165 RepID=A0AAX2CDU3_9BACI|nr:MerR family transcriptional regulator [Bacillus cytotoxicus]QTR83231.1 MerR family transcriptional regulator [Bacillus cytotoxicus]QTR86969.1 MerR family transcriptional regulator [Bacillus cytotoxicus]SCL85899.1 A0A073K8I9 (MerR family transcriptional regulator) [Bacillus cytotoxicus]